MENHIWLVISPSFGSFEPNRALESALKKAGLTDWSQLTARTDARIVSLVKTHLGKSKNNIDVAFLGKGKHQYLRLAQVDTSKHWTISNRDGSESVEYLAYTVEDSQINYCKKIG